MTLWERNPVEILVSRFDCINQFYNHGQGRLKCRIIHSISNGISLASCTLAAHKTLKCAVVAAAALKHVLNAYEMLFCISRLVECTEIQCGLYWNSFPSSMQYSANKHTLTNIQTDTRVFFSATQKEEPDVSCLPFVSHLQEPSKEKASERGNMIGSAEISARRQQRPQQKAQWWTEKTWEMKTGFSLNSNSNAAPMNSFNNSHSWIECKNSFILSFFRLLSSKQRRRAKRSQNSKFSSKQLEKNGFLGEKNSEIGDWETQWKNCNKKKITFARFLLHAQEDSLLLFLLLLPSLRIFSVLHRAHSLVCFVHRLEFQ